MKYNFQIVPDPNGDGFVSTYLRAKSTIINDNHYLLEISHDLDAPVECWTITRFYKSCHNGIWKDEFSFGVVYNGKQLTDDQRDMMVELVMEIDYLAFE